MNIVLFQPEEPREALAYGDPRATHIRGVLRMGPGDTLYVGIINGRRGKAEILCDDPQHGMRFAIAWEDAVQPLHPIRLIIGLPRPQTARRILREAAALGVAGMHWFQADKGEAGYAHSKLWTGGEWQRHMLDGVGQSFTTLMPEVTHHADLEPLLQQSHIRAEDDRVALDPYEATASLAGFCPQSADTLWLALGAERGWSARERDLLRTHRFGLYSLGARILRLETAVIAAFAIVASALERNADF